MIFETITDHIVAHSNLREFDPQVMFNTVWAFTKTEESNPSHFRKKKVADHAVVLSHLREFTPQNLANTVWAFANAEESQPNLFKKIADHIVALDNLRGF